MYENIWFKNVHFVQLSLQLCAIRLIKFKFIHCAAHLAVARDRTDLWTVV